MWLCWTHWKNESASHSDSQKLSIILNSPPSLLPLQHPGGCVAPREALKYILGQQWSHQNNQGSNKVNVLLFTIQIKYVLEKNIFGAQLREAKKLPNVLGNRQWAYAKWRPQELLSRPADSCWCVTHGFHDAWDTMCLPEVGSVSPSRPWAWGRQGLGMASAGHHSGHGM